MSTYQIINGNSAEVLKTFPDNHFDSVISDPPYLIGFLGKDWDHEDNDLSHVFKECLRVLKPGGYLLAFSAARTYHKIATMIEESGFEIRDQISWIYSSGFPKSQDVGRQLHKKEKGKPDKQRFDPAIMIKDGANYRHPDTGKSYQSLPDINGDRLAVSHEGKSYGCIFEEVIEVEDSEWSGWGTCLKPAQEPICMARKPLNQTVAKNCQEWGTGAINIDAGRIPFEGGLPSGGANGAKRLTFGSEPIKNEPGETYDPNQKGRFPSNVIGEIPDHQAYFYCPKVSRAERHTGFDTTQYRLKDDVPLEVLKKIEEILNVKD